MRLRKIIGTLHLWLGLAVGLLIIFLGVTGCILAFEKEIRDAREPFRFVEARPQPLAAPSMLRDSAAGYLKFGQPQSIDYRGAGQAVMVSYYSRQHYEQVFLNPYDGHLLKYRDMDGDFFREVIEGHFYLWLPHRIGQPIVATGTLIFVVMLITGIILWWPRNPAAGKQRFGVKWSLGLKRRNYDLHNVLGFYASWIALFIALTGLVMGFQWFSKSVYWLSSGGRQPDYSVMAQSDTTGSGDALDRLVLGHLNRLNSGEYLSVYLPRAESSPLQIIVNNRPGTYYKTDVYYYDRYTGSPLKQSGHYAGRFDDISAADQLARMNYDIHVGAIWGLPGKILAFAASLIVASLPITGFLIWRGRRRKRR